MNLTLIIKTQKIVVYNITRSHSITITHPLADKMLHHKCLLSKRTEVAFTGQMEIIQKNYFSKDITKNSVICYLHYHYEGFTNGDIHKIYKLVNSLQYSNRNTDHFKFLDFKNLRMLFHVL